MEKKIGRYWFDWGRQRGFSIGFYIGRYGWGLQLGFWYIGQEF